MPTGGREVGETVNYKWPEDGEYHEVLIVEKHDDGTYDVYFPEDEMEVERVNPSDFESFKGTSPTCYFTNLPSPLAYSLTHLITQSKNMQSSSLTRAA